MMIQRRQVPQKFVGRIAVDTEFGAFLGNTRIRLLEAIDRYGSISQAAKTIPLSYKAAWDAVDAMNNLAEHTLLDRSPGGRHGGGTRLTDYGRRMVAMYRAVEQESQQLLERLAERLGDAGVADVQHFQALLRRSSMRTSARNQFSGPVTGLREGEVSFEVNLRLDAEHELSAMISREGAENLGLAIGREVHALVNASAVILTTDPTIRTTARNQLWGEVSQIHDGPVNSDVKITLPGGRAVNALVTRESIANLDLSVGKIACALFKASSVILATFD
jgi:molybdate transport system regulatory protein